MKPLKITGAAVAAVIVILVLLMVVGIPSGFLTSTMQERVERATGYRLTTAGTTKISLWPTLNVSVSDVTLQDPKDRDGGNRVTIGNLQADMALSSLWSGHTRIRELIITKPVLYVPLLRERLRATAPASKPAASDTDSVTIDRITIANGAVTFSNPHDRIETRIDGIAGLATIDADRNITFDGIARAGDHPLKFVIKAVAPSGPVERQNIPVEVNFEAPGLLNGPLTAKSEVRLNGSLIMINGLAGMLGDGAFTGWASVDVSSKPLVKLDLDFQRLDIPVSKDPSTAARQGWSETPIDLTALNYVDAQARVSAAQIDFGQAHFAPAAIEAALAGVAVALGPCRVRQDRRQDAGEDRGAFRRRQPARHHEQPVRYRLRHLPGRPDPRAERGADDPPAHREHAVGLAGAERADDRSDPALRLVQDGPRTSGHDRSQSGRPAGEGDRRRYRRSPQQADRLPCRAAARDDHRRPEPRRRSGRLRHPRDDLRSVVRTAHLSRHGRRSGQSGRRLCQAARDGQRPVRSERRGPRQAAGRARRIGRQQPKRYRHRRGWWHHQRPARRPRPDLGHPDSAGHGRHGRWRRDRDWDRDRHRHWDHQSRPQHPATAAGADGAAATATAAKPAAGGGLAAAAAGMTRWM